PAPCRLFHSDAFFCKGRQQAVHVGRDGDGFSRGLNGVGHVLEAVAGDHTDHRVILADDALLAELLHAGGASDAGGLSEHAAGPAQQLLGGHDLLVGDIHHDA
ncbi:RusA family crossover junction endodeoxyribonuclease, partial [Dysosmobacter welbionis]